METTVRFQANPYNAACSSRLILERVGNKWVLLLLCLLSSGPKRFNVLRRAIDGVSQKVLTQTLRTLERDGMVRREVLPTSPVMVEYSVTELGLDLTNQLRGIMRWVADNMDVILDAQESFDRERPVRPERPLIKIGGRA